MFAKRSQSVVTVPAQADHCRSSPASVCRWDSDHQRIIGAAAVCHRKHVERSIGRAGGHADADIGIDNGRQGRCNGDRRVVSAAERPCIDGGTVSVSLRGRTYHGA